MIVIKLGGSLSESDALLECLNRVEQKYQGRAVVIVPGGGAFAEQVRMAQQHWQFDDKTAHHMAILAMQQMALLFKGLKPDFSIAGSLSDIREQLSHQRVVIWSPDSVQLDHAGIQATWNITSDSLSAWLAKALSADELILVKSANVDANLSFSQLAEQNIIDSAFCDFAAQADFNIAIINAECF
ncbi:MAG: uridylate kinase [Methylobacter sp.]|nr:uridylate kinase [Methylobacter sp.]